MKMIFEIESVQDAQEFQKALAVLLDKAPRELTADLEPFMPPHPQESETVEPEKAEVEHAHEQEDDEEEQEELALADVKRAVAQFEGGTKHLGVKYIMVTKFKITALKNLKKSDYAKFIKMVNERAEEYETADSEKDDKPVAKKSDAKTKANKKAKKAKDDDDEDAEEGYTLDSIRALVRPFVRAKQNGRVKEILIDTFGVEKLDGLDEDDYPAFVAELEELKEELGL